MAGLIWLWQQPSLIPPIPIPTRRGGYRRPFTVTPPHAFLQAKREDEILLEVILAAVTGGLLDGSSKK